MHERSKHNDEEVLQKECAGFLVVLDMDGGVAQEEVLGGPKEVAGFGGCHQTAAFTILRAERPGSRGFSATHLLSPLRNSRQRLISSVRTLSPPLRFVRVSFLILKLCARKNSTSF